MSTCGEPAAMSRSKRIDCRSPDDAKHSGLGVQQIAVRLSPYGGALSHSGNNRSVWVCCLELFY